jgi:hypothetical protein
LCIQFIETKTNTFFIVVAVVNLRHVCVGGKLKFFLWEFGPVLLTSFISSLIMKLDFISQPALKSTPPFAGLQHMQQCQVNFHSIFAPGFFLIQMNCA